MRLRYVLVAVGTLVLLTSACGHAAVTVYINGPETLAGAQISLDGELVGAFEAVHATPSDMKELKGPVSGSAGEVQVPLGKHELRIDKQGIEPIRRLVNYTARGEDYLAIDSAEVVPTQPAG